MSSTRKLEWRIYFFGFLAMWSFLLLIDFVPKLPADLVKHAALREGTVAALITLVGAFMGWDAARHPKRSSPPTAEELLSRLNPPKQ